MTDTVVLEMHRSINKDVTVVIPVLNEENAIAHVIKNLKKEGFTNILVVDGYSTDNTFSKATNNGVKVIYQKGEGKTGAIKTAVEQLDTPFLVLMDGDCTYDARDINNIVLRLNKADLVIGVRSIGRDNIPILNRFGNWVINFTFNVLMGTNLVDVCSGMYGLRTQFAKNLEFVSKGFDVEIEIVSQASKYGVIGQIPIRYHPRIGDQKLSPFKDGFKIILRVLMMAQKLSFLKGSKYEYSLSTTSIKKNPKVNYF